MAVFTLTEDEAEIVIMALRMYRRDCAINNGGDEDFEDVNKLITSAIDKLLK